MKAIKKKSDKVIDPPAVLEMDGFFKKFIDKKEETEKKQIKKSYTEWL